MHVTLFDDSARDSLLPLTFTRPVAELRIGILTISEKWQKYLNATISYYTADNLRGLYPESLSPSTLFVNGSVCPDERLLEAIDSLSEGQALVSGEVLLALKQEAVAPRSFSLQAKGFEKCVYTHDFLRIRYPEQLFLYNDLELKKDFALLTKGRTSAPLSSTNQLMGDQIFLEEGAKAECSIFNTLQGPVYLGKNSEVWEGCMVRGAFALCEGSQLKMGTKAYPKSTIGPYSRVGGEINNVVILANSSKGHEGYLGNSVIGEWCNLGADTNNSNLKNNYGEVKLWDYSTASLRGTGLQFCGLIMGDHSKAGINTMFNTGTVVGVGANVFGGGYPPNFVPDFSWGGKDGFCDHRPDKMIETAHRVFARRGKTFEDANALLMNTIFENTKHYRNY